MRPPRILFSGKMFAFRRILDTKGEDKPGGLGRDGSKEVNPAEWR